MLQCSSTCGAGLRKRNVTCRGGTQCHKATEPPATESCSSGPCPAPEEDSNNIPIDESVPKKPAHKHRHGHDTKPPKKSSRPRFVAKGTFHIHIIL